jgi:hypothetical protein
VIRSTNRVVFLLTAVLALFFAPAAATAAVEISFYSRELGGNNFPHAFVTLQGQPDGGGSPLNISYGFTAKNVSPAVLMGSVGGTVMNEPPSYVAKSDRQFKLVLPDERYRAVMAVIAKWQAKPQPSYNLNKANCVHFVREIAQAIGLDVDVGNALMKKPRSFLLAVKARNANLLSKSAAPGL